MLVAAQKNNVDDLKSALSDGANANAYVPNGGCSYTAIEVATHYNSTEAFKYLSELPGINFKAAGFCSYYNSALENSLFNGNLPNIKILVDKKVTSPKEVLKFLDTHSFGENFIGGRTSDSYEEPSEQAFIREWADGQLHALDTHPLLVINI